MLKIYLSTIFLWMVIIFYVVNRLYESIMRNGWVDQIEPFFDGSDYEIAVAFLVLLLVSAVPVFRACMVVMFYLMSKYTEDELKKLFSTEEGQNESQDWYRND